MEERAKKITPAADLPQKREWKIGDKLLDRYEIRDIKGGRGKSGMGIVYIALDSEWNQMFAIKTFQTYYLWDKDVIDRFMNEAETWVHLERHTNIVFANFVKKIEGMPCILLEYIDGGDLSQWIGRLDNPQILDFAIQFCNGMDYAYTYNKLGIIHRDIKPQNAMITSEGILKVTDFGLARAVGGKVINEELGLMDSAAVSRGSGTLPYMPPEQFPEEIQRKFHFLPKPVTTRSDVYSFGVTFYHVLTGELPFYTLDEIFNKIPVNPVTKKPDVPKQLDLLIMKCLEKNPENRYGSFAELMEELTGIYNDFSSEKKIFGEKYVVRGKKEPLTAIDWNNKGVALDNLGKSENAVECYDRALIINPRFANTWNNKGFALNNLGRFQEAIECYDRALEINPRFANTWNNKGFALNNLGRFQEAVECYDKALDINPRFAEAWNNKGFALSNLGRFQEAVECYDKALDINLRYAEAWDNKGLALSDLGEDQEAITCYDKALRIDPRLAEAWNNKGLALKNLGRSQEALNCYNKAIELNQKIAEAWNNKGVALNNLGNPQEAIEYYDKAIEINPRYANAWINKGLALVILGRHQEAISYFQKYIQLAPLRSDAQTKQAEEIIHLIKRGLINNVA